MSLNMCTPALDQYRGYEIMFDLITAAQSGYHALSKGTQVMYRNHDSMKEGTAWVGPLVLLDMITG